ncbi:MAG: hypothetical protein CVV42_14760 [Candidatus Riflebacteria bacterium HGW-Riflebacteria-2]|nr:MAG: hypothetical protein CVV42_14760 [Candidatus Riflebacteria bacterium HGW-Riflebacteria-2]
MLTHSSAGILIKAKTRMPSMVLIKASAATQIITPKIFCLLMAPTFHCYLDLPTALSEHKSCQPETVLLCYQHMLKRPE